MASGNIGHLNSLAENDRKIFYSCLPIIECLSLVTFVFSKIVAYQKDICNFLLLFRH